MKAILFTAALGISLATSFYNSNTNNNAPIVHSDSAYYTGEHYGGGIIFFLSSDRQHGLIAAPADQIKLVPWYNGKNKLTETSDEGKVKGAENTRNIVSSLSIDSHSERCAAKVCADYSIIIDGHVYDDWYLPSKYELDLLYQSSLKIGGFGDHYFWSSNEVNSDEAWVQSFYDGRQLNVSKSDENYVRAVRAF